MIFSFQFWNKRRQRLSCLHIDQAMSFSLLFQKITEEVSNYADIALQELCLKQQKDLVKKYIRVILIVKWKYNNDRKTFIFIYMLFFY